MNKSERIKSLQQKFNVIEKQNTRLRELVNFKNKQVCEFTRKEEECRKGMLELMAIVEGYVAYLITENNAPVEIDRAKLNDIIGKQRLEITHTEDKICFDLKNKIQK